MSEATYRPFDSAGNKYGELKPTKKRSLVEGIMEAAVEKAMNRHLKIVEDPLMSILIGLVQNSQTLKIGSLISQQPATREAYEQITVWAKSLLDTVTRFEIIDHRQCGTCGGSGLAHTRAQECSDCSGSGIRGRITMEGKPLLSLQDDGRTLKVFLK